MSSESKTLPYRRSHFATHLPLDYLYAPSHAWLAPHQEGQWRVGLTRFATRMLGEMVDHGFECEPGQAVGFGQVVGWVEGFKAISDLFSVVEGHFAERNAALKENIQLVSRDPYKAGWLYVATGEPDPKCMDAAAYARLLDKAIDRILAKQRDEIR